MPLIQHHPSPHSTKHGPIRFPGFLVLFIKSLSFIICDKGAVGGEDNVMLAEIKFVVFFSGTVED